jgi:hypothetical protein
VLALLAVLGAATARPRPQAIPVREGGRMAVMFVLRATKKLRDRIGQLPRHEGEPSTTLLGDWYATALLGEEPCQ